MTFELIYYLVPEEYRNYRVLDSPFGKLFLNNWTEIVLSDTVEPKTIIDLIRQKNYFVNDEQFLCQLLCNLKTVDEKLFFKTVKEPSTFELITSVSQLQKKILSCILTDTQYIIEYVKEEDIDKIIINTNSESLRVLIKEDIINEAILSICKYAKEESFSKYELGEE